MALPASEITPRFNKKLNDSIRLFAEKYNVPSGDIRIVLSPYNNNGAQLTLLYHVFAKSSKLADVTFSDIIKLDMLESYATNEKKITAFIISSISKFSIGAACQTEELKVMIYLDNGVQLALIKNKQIINYFLVDKLF